MGTRTTKQKPIAQQMAESDAMLNARDAAMQTPEEVRKAFLARRRECGPVYVEPFSLGILWLFEEIGHPFHTGRAPVMEDGKPKLDTGGKPVLAPFSFREIAQSIFIFHDSEAAAEDLASGKDVFDQSALSLARAIDPKVLPKINELVTKTYNEGLATIPGGGASNPTGTAS